MNGLFTRLSRRSWAALLFGLAALGLGARFALSANALTPEALARYYDQPARPLTAPLSVYHLGHSLVGRDMPVMLAALAGAGHSHASQLGWGASLKNHWTGDVPGFAEENTHATHRPAGEALDAGAYDAVIFTEMVEIRDAIRYHDSGAHLALWAKRALAGNPNARLYLYESWHRLDVADGWLTRLDNDLAEAWEGRLLAEAMTEVEHPIYVIPAGQVMAAFTRAVEAGQGGSSVRARTDLFGDQIHPNAAGNYLVALVHYAVLYQRSPVGLPVPGAVVDADTARLMQDITWQVVTSYPKTGVPQQ